jgi:hypothetical protein
METHHPNMVSQAGVSDRPEVMIIHEMVFTSWLGSAIPE